MVGGVGSWAGSRNRRVGAGRVRRRKGRRLGRVRVQLTAVADD